MKAVIIISYFCVALLPPIIRGNDELNEILKKMAEKNETINDIFQPSKNIGHGYFAITFKGTLLTPIRREVAMKFTPSNMKTFASEEFKIYSYLKAINNPSVEKYGIPSVYYYGEWNDYILMGLTLLDPEFNMRIENRLFDEVDGLILMQQFLKTLKYIHSYGVYHNDIKIYNIMFRRSQAFIIDYNVATKMYEKSKTGTSNILLTRDHLNQKQDVKSDWQRFIHTMCYFYNIQLNFYSISKDDLRQRINQIERDGIKRVLNAFVSYAFEDNNDEHHQLKDGGQGDAPCFPIYDHFYEIINEEIEKLKLPKPILVSWLKDDDVEKAKEELAMTPNISSIKNQFEKMNANYPPVHFDYFHPKQKNLSGNKHETAKHSNTRKK